MNVNLMCQVEGCNNKGIMVKGIVFNNRTYGSVTLDIFLCEEHNDDPRFLATEWISTMRSVSEMITDNIAVEQEPRVRERRKPHIASPSSSNSGSINRQRNSSSSSNTKRPKLKRNLKLP